MTHSATPAAPTDRAIAAHRQQFSALATKAYFNYGGQGPLADRTLTAIATAYQTAQEIGPFGQAANQAAMAQTQRTRAAIAQELGVSPATIALTEDVTVGCNIALWGIDWQAGDRLVMSDCEHPGVIAAVGELQHRFGIAVDLCPLKETVNGKTAAEIAAIVAAQLQPNTRLVVLSHIHWNTGQVLPLAEIAAACRRDRPATARPLQILIDAAQSVGVLPLDLDELDIDFYAFTGHKWWCGPDGVGGLYVRSGDDRPALRPTFIGWRGIQMDSLGNPTGFTPDCRRYEIATSAYPLYAGLEDAIALHQTWGSAGDRYDRLRSLSGQLWERLRSLPGLTCLKDSPPDAGLVSFQVRTPEGESRDRALVSHLESQGILTRILLDPLCVRASVHYLSSVEECDRLIDSIRTFLG